MKKAADHLSITFAALADPTRRAILRRLARGEASVTELAEPFAMSLPAVSRHLKVLQSARLITRTKDAQWRPCRLAPEPLAQIDDWLAQYRRHWDERLGRTDDYLQTLEKKQKPRRGPRISR